MNVESNNSTALDVIYLASCALKKKIPDKQRVATMDHEAILSLASNHMMSTITAIALESAGIKTQSTATAITNGVRRDYFFDKAWKEISAQFEEAGVWYLPLKGAVLKEYYPKPGMREFSDYDILFDKTKVEKVKEIMHSLGFEMQHDDFGHDIAFYKQPVLNFEMHTHLFGVGHEQIMNDYYDNIRDRLLKDSDNNYGYHMSDEDFYIYMIAHEYKHYSSSEMGLRSLLDTYVYLSTVNLNQDYIKKEFEKIGISEFANNNRLLSEKLFMGQTLSDMEAEMLGNILPAVTYGILDRNGISDRIKKSGGSKIKYIIWRFLVPIRKSNPNYLDFSAMYPWFYKNKLRICLLPFYRTFKSVKNKSIMREINAIVKAKN